VPRGLVSLRDLAIVWVATIFVQLGLALWFQPSLTVILALVGLYLALMSNEFFVGEWLKSHPIVYLVSHMVIIPLVDLYATACDWWPTEGRPPHGLIWFLVVSYFNGIVIEIGRKIRAPKDEEVGVNTYSFIWGVRTAAFAWLGTMLATASCAAVAAYQIDFLPPVVGVLSVLFVVAAFLVVRFLRDPGSRRAKHIETLSGIWTLLMYLILGAIPLLWRCWHLSEAV
jgi:4-hydroxybenzoate polyprenyltransferase